MATLTLEKMAAGGIYDQVGGGFHRYSTDAAAGWCRTSRRCSTTTRCSPSPTSRPTRRPGATTSRAWRARSCATSQRDMTVARRARSTRPPTPTARRRTASREEGWFFTWTPAEIDAGARRAAGARSPRPTSRSTAKGNFEGRNILHRRDRSPSGREAGPAARGGCDALRRAARERLYAARAKRPPPLRDEKILAAWNGLMISALRARRAGARRRPLRRRGGARRGASCSIRMRRDGRLCAATRTARPQHDAYLDDYAFVDRRACSTSTRRTATRAGCARRSRSTACWRQHFEDPKAGGFFLTATTTRSFWRARSRATTAPSRRATPSRR